MARGLMARGLMARGLMARGLMARGLVRGLMARGLSDLWRRVEVSRTSLRGGSEVPGHRPDLGLSPSEARIEIFFVSTFTRPLRPLHPILQ